MQCVSIINAITADLDMDLSWCQKQPDFDLDAPLPSLTTSIPVPTLSSYPSQPPAIPSHIHATQYQQPAPITVPTTVQERPPSIPSARTAPIVPTLASSSPVSTPSTQSYISATNAEQEDPDFVTTNPRLLAAIRKRNKRFTDAKTRKEREAHNSGMNMQYEPSLRL